MMKGRREKVVLVFDEKDRRDFLTGFRKRKNARRKKAQEENKQKETEKRKQLREEKREALRQHIEEYKNQVNNTEIDDDIAKKTEVINHDFGQHTVTVSTITQEDMGKDFTTYSTEHHPRTADNKLLSKTDKQPSKEKSLTKKQFRKKAQKRKIQALRDKKSKQKLKQKGKKKM